jgi:hypothetical protein
MLCGDLAMLQAPLSDDLLFDPFALFDDGFGPSEVGGGRRSGPPDHRAGSNSPTGCGS